MNIVKLCPTLEGFSNDKPPLIDIQGQGRNAILEVNITDMKCISCTRNNDLVYVKSMGGSLSGSDKSRSSKVHLVNIELSENSNAEHLMRFINVKVYLHNG